MHDAIAAAITAAAATPTITEDVARFADGTTVTRHVIHYPAAPTAVVVGGELVPLGNSDPYTLTAFEIRDPQGRVTDGTQRITITPEA